MACLMIAAINVIYGKNMISYPITRGTYTLAKVFYQEVGHSSPTWSIHITIFLNYTRLKIGRIIIISISSSINYLDDRGQGKLQINFCPGLLFTPI